MLAASSRVLRRAVGKMVERSEKRRKVNVEGMLMVDRRGDVLINGRIESDGLTQSGRRTRRARRGKRIFAGVTFVLAIIER